MAAVQETIRITGRDNRLRQRQLTDRTGFIALSREDPVVSMRAHLIIVGRVVHVRRPPEQTS